jgi:hypothetical protein
VKPTTSKVTTPAPAPKKAVTSKTVAPKVPAPVRVVVPAPAPAHPVRTAIASVSTAALRMAGLYWGG